MDRLTTTPETGEAKPPAEALSQEPDTRAIANHIIAHELTNIAGAIQNQLELAQRTVTRLFPICLMTLANVPSYMRSPELLDINEVLRQHEPDLIRTLGLEIEFEMKLWSSARRITADVNLIKALFTNFAINAADAMELCKVKRFRIETLDLNSDVIIRVSDTGMGMDDQTQARILGSEKFTTKIGHLGEGMTYMREIIDSLKGTLRISSTPGLGTTFLISFPVNVVAGLVAGASAE